MTLTFHRPKSGFRGWALAAIALAPLRPLTATGTSELVVVPLPSCPPPRPPLGAAFAPQHWTFPSDITAHA